MNLQEGACALTVLLATSLLAGCTDTRQDTHAGPAYLDVWRQGSVASLGPRNDTSLIDGQDAEARAPALAAAFRTAIRNEFAAVQGKQETDASVRFLEDVTGKRPPLNVEFEGWYFAVDPPPAFSD